MLKIVKETFYDAECLVFSIFTRRERPTLILRENCSLNLSDEVKKLVETKNPKYWKPV